MGDTRRYVSHYNGPRKQDLPTPRDFFERLHADYQFTMDGAATAKNAFLPRYSSTRKPLSWIGETVFCNPPWSNIKPFVQKATASRFACLLVPARVNAKWFHYALDLGLKAKYFCGKLSFGGPWNSPVDCLLLIWAAAPGGTRDGKRQD